MNVGDEFFHVPKAEPYWSESHYLDGVDLNAGVALQARIGFYPNRESASVFAYVYLDADDAIYWIREEDVPPAAAHGLLVETDDWAVGFHPEDPPSTWTVRIEGELGKTPADDPAGLLDDPAETVTGRAEFDVESRHDPFYYSEGATFPADGDADRYEVATRVSGTVAVDGPPRQFDGPGERDHSWGRRKWTGDAEWLWISGGFDDGTAYNHLTFWPAGEPTARMINGFYFDGDTRHPLTEATVQATPTFGEETTRDWMAGKASPRIRMDFEWADGTTSIDVEPLVTTPIEWRDESRNRRAILNRAASRQIRDGTISGSGFLENLGQLELE